MNFEWLKRPMPRSLYARAALILILPIVLLQLVVSVVFIQRHFADVTRQMTDGVAMELRYVLDTARAAPDRAQALERLAPFARAMSYDLSYGAEDAEAPAPVTNRRRFYDLTGITVMDRLRAQIPELRKIDLAADSSRVALSAAMPKGEMQLSFSRRRVSASNPHQLLVLMILAGALMTGVAFVFLRNQLRPIRRLSRAAEAFGKGRVLPYRPAGALEVRAAGNAFLDMRARIERQIEQRTLMLSGVSHDLRTPLTRMKLAVSMLEPGPDTEALARDLNEMQEMLDGFLAFAQGDGADALDPTDPYHLAETLVEDAHRAGQNVSLARAPGSARSGTVPMRPMAVRRALGNLLSNATRYGTQARLTVALTPGALRFAVEDDGPGIAPEDRETALRPFARLEAARNQNRGPGVGLGLAIAADIARSHGGILRLGDSADLGGLKAELVLAR
ncbi:two-component sensor histidine kinase [Maritimibacter sp. 55A14]|uniref:ATP-binding protein n=1 Tax=Maritimibacter sp. 55A14 TaxID=2174844 RepID=UPI000D61E46C|nr:ATP-binding protein [Maritimibacter sp. 55A14]PWE34145.1 two-component sensor histidine kinase [Maritimibacter sp. 55A14]